MTQIWTPGRSMAFPHGVVGGCLPRESKVGTHAPLFREAFEVLSISECDRIIRERKDAGLLFGKSDVPEIHYQDGIGSCASEQTTLAYEVTSKRMGMSYVKLNPWPSYYYASGGRDSGSSLEANVEVGRTRGFIPDELWPRYDSSGNLKHRWNDLPPKELWEQAVFLDEVYEVHPDNYYLEIATGLVKGFVAGIGWDSHSELFVEYEEGGNGLVANSWGKTWNGDGFHHESIRKANMGYGAFLYRTNQQR